MELLSLFKLKSSNQFQNLLKLNLFHCRILAAFCIICLNWLKSDFIVYSMFSWYYWVNFKNFNLIFEFGIF